MSEAFKTYKIVCNYHMTKPFVQYIFRFQRGPSYITDQLNENYVFTYSVLK